MNWQESIARNPQRFLPLSLESTYAGEYGGAFEFLGVREMAYADFEELKTYARTLGFTSSLSWIKHATSTKHVLASGDIPAHPSFVYAGKGWVSWGDFLGSGNVCCVRPMLSYADAKKFVHTLKLPNYRAWRNYAKSGKKPNNLPYHPPKVYKKDWVSYYDFLGKRRVSKPAKPRKLTYDEARSINLATFVAQVSNPTWQNWLKWSKEKELPAGLCATPWFRYKLSGWTNWRHWVGRTP